MENRRGPVEAPRDRGHLKGAPLAMARVAAPLVATALVATALVATALALAAPALAGVVLNTINRSAALNDAGRLVEVSGPIRCSQLEQASIRVTVSQRRTGAVAEGRWRGVPANDPAMGRAELHTRLGGLRDREGAGLCARCDPAGKQGHRRQAVAPGGPAHEALAALRAGPPMPGRRLVRGRRDAAETTHG